MYAKTKQIPSTAQDPVQGAVLRRKRERSDAMASSK